MRPFVSLRWLTYQSELLRLLAQILPTDADRHLHPRDALRSSIGQLLIRHILHLFDSGLPFARPNKRMDPLRNLMLLFLAQSRLSLGCQLAELGTQFVQRACNLTHFFTPARHWALRSAS